MAKTPTKRSKTRQGGLSNSGSTSIFQEESPKEVVGQRSLRNRVVKVKHLSKKKESKKLAKKNITNILQTSNVTVEHAKDRTFSLSPVHPEKDETISKAVILPSPVASSTCLINETITFTESTLNDENLDPEVIVENESIVETSVVKTSKRRSTSLGGNVAKRQRFGVSFGGVKIIPKGDESSSSLETPIPSYSRTLRASNLKKSHTFDSNETPSPSRKPVSKSILVKTPFKASLKKSTRIDEISSPAKQRPRFNSESISKTPASPFVKTKSTSKQHDTTGQKSKNKHFSRTKLPNFAKLHEKNFEHMESLLDHAKRKAERAKVLLTPGVSSSTKSGFGLISNPSYNRFGFKGTQTIIKKEVEVQPVKKPVSTADVRRERHIQMSKKTVVKTETTTTKRREILKGVRLNKRFELQMKYRDCN